MKTKFRACLLALICSSPALAIPPPGSANVSATELNLRSDTMNRDDRFNVRVGAISMLFGVANATLDFAADETITVGPKVAYARDSYYGGNASAYALGVEANFFLSSRRFNDGWIFKPSVTWAHAESDFNEQADGAALAAEAGYAWFWGSGFNIALTGGVQYISITSEDLGISDFKSIWPAATFTLGYSF